MNQNSELPAERKLALLICIGLVLLTVGAYWQVVGHGFINYDDDDYVTANLHVNRGLTASGATWAFGFHEANWHPLTWISHMIDCTIFGRKAGGHHAVNLILHLASTILLFLVLRRMLQEPSRTGDPDRRRRLQTAMGGVRRLETPPTWAAAFVAALFAVHPLHVESVAWVAERKDVLSTFFLMLTLLAYTHYVERPGIGRYLLVAGAFALGLMSKPMLVTLPLLLLLLDWWPLGRVDAARRGGLQRPPDAGVGNGLCPVPGAGTEAGPYARSGRVRDGGRTLRGDGRPSKVTTDSISRSDMRKVASTDAGRPLKASPTALIVDKLPLFGLAAASGTITFIAQHRGLAVGSLAHYPIGVRVANALVAYVTYLVKMVYPTGLAVFYPHPGSSLPVWQVIGSAILLAGITALVVRARRKHPYLAVGWLWYLITLIPVIGLVQVGMQAMADRYTYVPLVGIFMAVAYGSVGVWGYGSTGKTPTRPHPHTPILASLIILGCTVATWHQVGYWKDSETLFRHALAVTKNNAVAENNLGLALADEGKLDEAIRHHRCAADLNPGWADARYSLGAALFRNGQPDLAIPEFEAALAIDRNHAQAHQNLGAALIQLGDLPRAIEHLRRAVEIRPDYTQAYNNLGTAYSLQGKLDQSVRLFRRATEIDPGFADAHYNLALDLGQQNRIPEAITECRKVLALRPKWPEAQNNLAWFLVTSPDHTLPDAEEAVRLAEQACKTTRNTNPQYLDTLAAAYEAAGRHEHALRTAQKALALVRSSQRQ